jgi:hypothetical protein
MRLCGWGKLRFEGRGKNETIEHMSVMGIDPGPEDESLRDLGRQPHPQHRCGTKRLAAMFHGVWRLFLLLPHVVDRRGEIGPICRIVSR